MTLEEYFGDWMEVMCERDLLLWYKWALGKLKTANISFEPDIKDVFRAFRSTTLSDCKVIIVGQDPYPQHKVATGLAFANRYPYEPKLSPSLEVIRDSVLSLADKEELPIFDPSLESWAAQGILLLNSALTVKTDQPGSHSEAWKPFLTPFVENTCRLCPEIFWIFFGQQAWKYADLVPEGIGYATERHPSYFARNNIPMGNWMWQKMIKHVKEKFGVTIKLYD